MPIQLMSVELFIYFQKGPVHWLDSWKRPGMESSRISSRQQGPFAYELNFIKYKIAD